MKKRIQVTINPELLAEAKRLMSARKFDSVSEFLEALIREEWERRMPKPDSPLGKSSSSRYPSHQPPNPGEFHESHGSAGAGKKKKAA